MNLENYWIFYLFYKILQLAIFSILRTGIASMTEQPRRFANATWQLVVYSPNNFLFINMFNVKTVTGK